MWKCIQRALCPNVRTSSCLWVIPFQPPGASIGHEGQHAGQLRYTRSDLGWLTAMVLPHVATVILGVCLIECGNMKERQFDSLQLPPINVTMPF